MQRIKLFALAAVATAGFTGAALASQGPGTSPGTASSLVQWFAVLCGIGFVVLGVVMARRHAGTRRGV